MMTPLLDVYQVLVIVAIMLPINVIMFIYLGTVVYSFIKFQQVRDKMIEAFENADTKAHTEDAFKAVTLSFAIVFGWASLDVFLMWTAFPEKDLLPVVSGLTIIFAALLGITIKGRIFGVK